MKQREGKINQADSKREKVEKDNKGRQAILAGLRMTASLLWHSPYNFSSKKKSLQNVHSARAFDKHVVIMTSFLSFQRKMFAFKCIHFNFFYVPS